MRALPLPIEILLSWSYLTSHTWCPHFDLDNSLEVQSQTRRACSCVVVNALSRSSASLTKTSVLSLWFSIDLTHFWWCAWNLNVRVDVPLALAAQPVAEPAHFTPCSCSVRFEERRCKKPRSRLPNPHPPIPTHPPHHLLSRSSEY